jgi:multidrug efflux system outer membrane protein
MKADMKSPALLLVSVLVLPGCMVGPDYVRPDVDTPDKWRVEYKDATDISNTAWWQQLEDPVLDGLILAALESNKDVRFAAARVEEFAARLSVTRSELYPQIGYGGSAERTQASREGVTGIPPGVDRTNDAYQATLSAGWELDIWGRIRRASEAARANLLAAEEGRRTVILTLVSSVATSYIELRSLDKQLEIARGTLDTRGASLKLFELKFKGGVVSELELAQLRSEYEQAAVRIPAIERQIALLENSLSILLGRNPGPIPRGKTLQQLTLPVIPAGVPSAILERRPDIREAEQNLIAANAQIGVARSLYFPSISLTGLFGYASADLSDLSGESANTWNLGGQLLGPIFTGGLISGQVQASEAVQRQALFDYLSTVQRGFREVDDALVSNQKLREELEAQGRRVNALKDYARFATLRYDEGQVSYIEVLDSESRLFDAELIYTQNQGEVYTSLIDVYKAMGGGWILEAEGVANKVDYASGNGAESSSAQEVPDSK